MADPAPTGAKPPGRGLTLLEGALALAILGGIAGFVVAPSIRRAALRRNEGRAIASVRALVSAQEQYLGRWGAMEGWAAYDGPTVYTDPGALRRLFPGLVDEALAGGRKDGYSFAMGLEGQFLSHDGGRPVPAWNAFSVSARPLVPGATGERWFFYHAHDGTLRYRLGAPASPADSPVE